MNKSLGDWSGGVTPGNIPNPAVKSVSADGTWRATSWESRSSPRDFSFNNSARSLFLCVYIVYNYRVSSVEGRKCPILEIKRSVKRTNLSVDRFVVSFYLSYALGRFFTSADFLAIPCGKEVTCFGICKFT